MSQETSREGGGVGVGCSILFIHNIILCTSNAIVIPVNMMLLSVLFFYREDRSILLDCGEGTFSQLRCLYKEQTADTLASLKCVFISHRHPDHHMVK